MKHNLQYVVFSKCYIVLLKISESENSLFVSSEYQVYWIELVNSNRNKV